ncbi:LSU ribosomal protein L4p (L1e) [[Mycoplasma] cavipharyngis]|uniref:50S ribosomal protein L4 n=1 Tax=[Mycoplasma] cavipharyngis TaxID=92757 RepID=UPI003703D886
MNALKIIDLLANPIGEFKLSQELLNHETIHHQSLFDSVLLEQAAQRQGTHSTKTKAEVSGTGKKPFEQKHSGNARQGSKRNPHFVGGGVAFGPKPNRNYTKIMNRKVYSLAYLSALSRIILDQKITLLTNDALNDSLPKTKVIANLLYSLNLNDKKILLIVNDDNPNLFLAARNLKHLIVKFASSVSVRDLLNNYYVIAQVNSFELILHARINIKTTINYIEPSVHHSQEESK